MKRILALGGIGIGLMLCSASAQQSNWTPPKTAWGEPDLEGIWPLNHLIATPFQRPEKYGDPRFESGAIPQADSGTQVMRFTSLLSEPANGRFPALTPSGKQLYEKMHG